MIAFEIAVHRARPGDFDTLFGPLDADRVLSLTLFCDARTTTGLESARRRAHTALRRRFGGSPPPLSVVAQAPEGGGLALEAAVLAAPGCVERRTLGSCAYTVVTRDGLRQVHAAGLRGDHRASRAAQARRAFARMRAVLRREGMSFDHVVRQWGYIEDILAVRPEGGHRCQGYQAFNDVRAAAYASCRFPAGYPAATGIGQAAGGVVLEFIALRGPPEVQLVPLSNPKQVDAHAYSPARLVGQPLPVAEAKATPKFERAKLLRHGGREALFVSGTASIVGDRSVGIGDVAAQTRTTIENLRALCGPAGLTHLRAYVKRARDVPVVRRLCTEAFGELPALYVVADVCREELLVEIEGARLPRIMETEEGR